MNAITVSDLTKVYQIPNQRQVPFSQLITGVFNGNWHKDNFVALQDISLTVRKGEWLGIIGHNGCGKSTLLKCVANTIRPTKGTVQVNGRIAAFLELGVGFQWDLSLEENIKLYGAIMGIPDEEITAKIDDILEFSDTERFRNAKLRALSSGMFLRLAFATAIQTKPEILLLDEVMNVGDLEFQAKCARVFREYRDEHGITAMLVSHDLETIRRYCDRVVMLDHGQMIGTGTPDEMIARYIASANRAELPAAAQRMETAWRTTAS